jgi:GT2 family glycosyltransferase
MFQSITILLLIVLFFVRLILVKSINYKLFNCSKHVACGEMKKQQGKVYIIVINFNGRDFLRKCLQSLLKETKYENYEIIVTDNNSTDGSIEMIEKNFPKIKLIKNKKNYGFSGGNNIGAKYALKQNAQFILFLNNDTEVTKGWLSKMVKTVNSKHEIGIVGPRFLYPDGTLQNNCYKYRYGFSIALAPDKISEVDCVVAACMLIKRSVIEEIGLLDEGYFPIYFEDIDFCFRAKKAGYKVVCVPYSIVYHHKGKTMKKHDWQYETYHTNRIRFILKNFPPHWIFIRGFIEWWNIAKAIKERRLKILLSIYSKALRNL